MQQFLKILLYRVKVVLHYRILAYFPYLKLYSKILFFDQDHHCVFWLMHSQVHILQRWLNWVNNFSNLSALIEKLLMLVTSVSGQQCIHHVLELSYQFWTYPESHNCWVRKPIELLAHTKWSKIYSCSQIKKWDLN